LAEIEADKNELANLPPHKIGGVYWKNLKIAIWNNEHALNFPMGD